MAVKLGSSDDDTGDEVSEINVTPFIDVMLVLLIIFMVAAPLSTVDVPVDLPTSNAAPQERPDEPVYLTIQEDLSLSLGEDPITAEALAESLDRRTDVWSLGVMLYECVTLERPFEAPSREGLYQQILAREPEDPRRLNPSVPRDLVTVIATALAGILSKSR